MNENTLNDPPLTAGLSSAFSFFVILLIAPLSIGGSISLAAYFGDLDERYSSPTDANGFSYSDGEQGKYTAYSSSVTYSTTATKYDKTWTSLPKCTLSSGGDCAEAPFTSLTDAPLTITIPDVFQYDEDIVSINVDWYSSTTFSVCTDIDSGWEFDWSFIANGDTIFTVSDEQETVPYKKDSETACRSYLSVSHTFSVPELNDLRQVFEACEPNCVYEIQFDNPTNLDLHGTGNDYSHFPATESGYIRVYTEDLSGIKGSSIMTVFPYAIGITMFTIALASTSLWDPLTSTAKLVKGGSKK